MHFSKFSSFRWEAGKAQFWTAGVGVLGALAALSLDSSAAFVGGRHAAFVLAFAAGGFLHIALATLAPELAKDSGGQGRETAWQLCLVGAGAAVMYGLALF